MTFSVSIYIFLHVWHISYVTVFWTSQPWGILVLVLYTCHRYTGFGRDGGWWILSEIIHPSGGGGGGGTQGELSISFKQCQLDPSPYQVPLQTVFGGVMDLRLPGGIINIWWSSLSVWLTHITEVLFKSLRPGACGLPFTSGPLQTIRMHAYVLGGVISVARARK